MASMSSTTPRKDTHDDEAGEFEASPRPLFNMELRQEDIEIFGYIRKAYKSPNEAGRMLTKADTIRRAMKSEAVRLGYKLRV